MRKPMLILLGLTLGVAVSGLAAEKEFSGASGGSWFEPGNWSPNGVPSADDDVTIPAGIVVRADGVPTAKSLAIADGAGLSIFGANAVYTEAVQFENNNTHTANSYGRIALNATATDAIGLSVAGDVSVSGAGWLAVGGFSQGCAASVTIGGDLTLSGTAKMAVYAGPGASAAAVGSTLSVAGALTVGGGTMLELNNHVGVKTYGVNATAAHVGITADAFSVSAGGLVRSVVGANEYTLAAFSSGRAQSPDYAGSGHGGAGGWGATGVSAAHLSGGAAYDNELMPLQPGQMGRYITVGPGVVDIEAGTVSIAGTVDVSAAIALVNWERGGCAGGSIFILCDEFDLARTGLLAAKGMDSYLYSSKCSGGGGGGRIAVGVGLSDEAKEELRAGGTTELISPVLPLVDRYTDACVDVSGGKPAANCGTAEPGTAVLYYGRNGNGPIVTVAATPMASAGKLPASFYTPLQALSGQRFETVTEGRWYLNGEKTVAIDVVGWTLTATDGTVLGSGVGNSCSVASLTQDARLTWTLSDEMYKISLTALGGGAVPEEVWCERGKTVTIEPTDATGFLRWLDPDNWSHGDTGETSYTVGVFRPTAMTALFDGIVFADKTYVGVSGGDWDEPANWNPAGVPTFADRVTIPAGLTVGAKGSIYAASLALGENAVLSVYGEVNDFVVKSLQFGWVTSGSGNKATLTNVGRMAYSTTGTDLVSVTILGSFDLAAGARAAFGGLAQTAPLMVSADTLTVSNGAKLAIYPGALDGATVTSRTGGARLSVSGALRVASGGELVLHGHLTPRTASDNVTPATSAAVSVEAGEFAVEAGATVSAHTGASWPNVLPGGATDGQFSGAGHGGIGGSGGNGGLKSAGGTAYDEPYAPRHPGASGRYCCNFGGGQIRVTAKLLTLAGTLDASSTIVNQTWEQGGGAGGSVFIVAGKADIADTAEVLSNGMNGKSTSTSYLNGGGAGGRISLVVNAPAEAIDSLWETGDWVNDRFTKTDLVANPGSFAGTMSVAGGTGANNGTDGGVGTAYLCEYLDASVAMVTIEADCADADGTLFDPPLAAQQMEAGKPFAATAPEHHPVVADGSVRRTCTGYTLYNAADLEVETVAGVHTFDLALLEGNIRLVWHFGAEEHRVDTDDGVMWKAVGEPVTLTAEDAGFRGWLFSGPASPEALRGLTLTFAADAPYRAYALDGTAGVPLQDRTFVGEDGGWWHDPANWSPEGEPTLGDNVIVPVGKTVNVFATGVAGALTVGEGATVSVFGVTNALYACVDIPHLGTGDQFVAERSRIGRHAADFARHLAPALLVKGDMTVDAGASIAVGGLWQVESSALQVGGNLTLSGAETKLHVYAASTNGVSLVEATGGGRVTVGGTLTIGDGATLEVYDAAGKFANDVRLGWVSFDLGSLVVAEGGTLKAAFGGCSSVKDTYAISQADSQVGGTGHGGRGGSGYGNSMSSAGGRTYDDPYYPRLPGQFSRAGDTFGGGVLAIAAKSVTVNGRIAADAERIISNYEHGGAAGGTVRIVTDAIVFGENGLVSANGHDAEFGMGSTYHTGGGGGGRISVIVGFSPAKLAGLAAGNEKIITRRMVALDQTAPEAKYAGHFSVAGGLNSHGDDKGGTDGEPGTAFVIYSRDPGLQILVR